MNVDDETILLPELIDIAMVLTVSERAAGDTSAKEPTTDAEEKLKSMADLLRRFDSYLLLKHCCSARPTTSVVLRLVWLIWSHSESQIMLFLMETGSKRKPCPPLNEDEAAQLSHAKEILYHFHKQQLSGGGGYIDPRVMLHELFQTWFLFSTVKDMFKLAKAQILRELLSSPSPSAPSDVVDLTGKAGKQVAESMCPGDSAGGGGDWSNTNSQRKSIGRAPRMTLWFEKVAAAADTSGEEEDNGQALELVLRGIWLDLASTCRRRSYAPPPAEEIKYYHEIRKWAVSSIGSICARVRLQEISNSFRDGEKEWFPIMKDKSYCSLDHVPHGWQLGMVLDEIPELFSLIRDAIDDLSGIFREEAVVSRASHEEEAATHSMPMLAKVHQLHSSDDPSASTNYVKKTRSEYLRDILSVLKSIDWDTELTIEEARLYEQIEEHVRSSIWLFQCREGDVLFHSSLGNSRKDRVVAGAVRYEPFNFPGGRNVKDGTSMRLRKQKLEQIVSSFEAIRSFYMDTPPTASEMDDYKAINKCLDTDFMEVHMERLRGKAAVSNVFIRSRPYKCTPLEISSLKYIRNCVYEKQQKVLKHIKEELESMAKKLFPGIQNAHEGTCFLCHADKKALIHQLVLCSPGGLTILERSILILEKLVQIADKFFSRLFQVNEEMGMYLECESEDYERGEDFVKEFRGGHEVWNSIVAAHPEFYDEPGLLL